MSMKRKYVCFIIILNILLNIISCKKDEWIKIDNQSDCAVDFKTPQGAILSLDEAYKSKDISKILNCKNFDIEALYLIKYEMRDELTTQAINEISKQLRNNFISEMKEQIPDISEIKKKEFVRFKKIDNDIVIINEIDYYTDGTNSSEYVLVGKGKNGWKVLFVSQYIMD